MQAMALTTILRVPEIVEVVYLVVGKKVSENVIGADTEIMSSIEGDLPRLTVDIMAAEARSGALQVSHVYLR